MIAVDTAINPKGWGIQIFMRKSNPYKRKRLERLLHTLEIPFETSPRFVHQRFEYATDLEEQISPDCRRGCAQTRQQRRRLASGRHDDLAYFSHKPCDDAHQPLPMALSRCLTARPTPISNAEQQRRFRERRKE